MKSANFCIAHHKLLLILFFVLTAHSCSKTHLRQWCIMGDSAPSKYDAVFLPPPQPQTQRPTVGIARIPPRTGFCSLPCRSFRGLPTFWTSKPLTIITCHLIFYLFTCFRLRLAQQARATTQSAVSQNRSQCGTLSVFCWWTVSLTCAPIRQHILSFCCWRWKCIHTGISFYWKMSLPLVSNWICWHKVHGTNPHNSQNAFPPSQDRILHTS